MKNLKTITGALIIAMFFALAFSSSEAEDKVPGKDRPKYEITVTQNGQELGTILIETFPDVAPKHARNFDSLVSVGFYDGTAFHRVIPGFMIQGGDPNSKDKPKEKWGFGAPGQTTVPAEFSNLKHKRGIISAARSANPNSATSQFFIMHGDAPQLDGQYSIYGQVLEGLDVVDKIVNVPTEKLAGRQEKSTPVDKVEMTIKKVM